MASLPSDRTKLALAQSNENPGIAAGSSVLKNTLTEAYDTIDLLNQKVDGLVGASTLSPYPPSNLLRNGFINSNMEVIQRFAPLGSATLTTGTSAYFLDRYKSINNGSGVNATVSQIAVSDLDGANLGLQLVHAALPSVGGQLMHIYTMKAKDAYKYAGKTVTFQIKVKAVAGMDRATLKVRYRTTEIAVTDVDALVLAGSAIPISSSIWTTISITVTLPNRATLTTTGVFGFQIVGSKTTAEASGDGFIVSEWGLNEGSSVLPFQPRSFDEELAMCIPFYEKSYDYGTAPATATATGAVSAVSTSTNILIGNRFKATKRISAPTVTIYSPSGTLQKVWGSADTDVSSGVVGSNIGDSGYRFVNCAASSLTAGLIHSYHYTCDAEL